MYYKGHISLYDVERNLRCRQRPEGSQRRYSRNLLERHLHIRVLGRLVEQTETKNCLSRVFMTERKG